MLAFTVPALPLPGSQPCRRTANVATAVTGASGGYRPLRNVGGWEAAQGAFAALVVAQCCVAQRRRKRAAAAQSRSRSRVAVAAAGGSTLQKIVKKVSDYPEEKPKEGDLVRIHYVGKLEDGSVFDSSRARGEPFEFHLGESEVIDGWDMLIGTMALGEVADLTIPPEFAYGEAGMPPVVPPSSTLTYNVEIIDIGTPVEDDDDEDDSDDEYEDEDTLLEGGKLFWEEDEKRESGRGKGYKWQASGNGEEIIITVPLKEDTYLKDVKVDVRTFSINITIGDKVVLDGKTAHEVQMDDSMWDFEQKGKKVYLIVTVAKLDPTIEWESVVKPEAERVEAEVLDVDAALRAANARVSS